jgi:hypothetical protein
MSNDSNSSKKEEQPSQETRRQPPVKSPTIHPDIPPETLKNILDVSDSIQHCAEMQYMKIKISMKL